MAEQADGLRPISDDHEVGAKHHHVVGAMPHNHADILQDIAAALMSFDERIHHGNITIHIGEGDYQLEVNRHYRKVPRLRAATPVPAPKWRASR